MNRFVRIFAERSRSSRRRSSRRRSSRLYSNGCVHRSRRRCLRAYNIALDGASYNIEHVSVSMAKAMAVGAEIKVYKHLWDGSDGAWQETTILDVRGAEVGVLQ